MFSRKNNYDAGAPDGGAVDDLQRKLAVDLRKHVRKLEAHQPLTKEWNDMIESLHHVANIAGMEHRATRKDGGDNNTLWEGDDLTVRFLLEEGKLNLCLRLMFDFADVRCLSESELSKFTAACSVEDAQALKQRMRTFEQDLGLLLRCAFAHVEAVQTTDLPVLFAHCKKVLDQAMQNGISDVSFDRTQELMVMFYLSSVCARMERLGEEKLMPHILDNGLVAGVVSLLSKYEKEYPKEGKQAAAEFLAHVFDSEEYGTHKAKYVTPEVPLKAVMKPIVTDLTKDDVQLKKCLRPLIDVVDRS